MYSGRNGDSGQSWDDEAFEAVARIYGVPVILILKLELEMECVLRIIYFLWNDPQEEALMKDLRRAIYINCSETHFRMMSCDCLNELRKAVIDASNEWSYPALPIFAHS